MNVNAMKTILLVTYWFLLSVSAVNFIMQVLEGHHRVGYHNGHCANYQDLENGIQSLLSKPQLEECQRIQYVTRGAEDEHQGHPGLVRNARHVLKLYRTFFSLLFI